MNICVCVLYIVIYYIYKNIFIRQFSITPLNCIDRGRDFLKEPYFL